MSEQELKILWSEINKSSNCNDCYKIDTINEVLSQYFDGVKSGSLPKYDSASNSADVANKLVASTGETSGRIQKILFYMEKLGKDKSIVLQDTGEKVFLGLTGAELLFGAGIGILLYFIFMDIKS